MSVPFARVFALTRKTLAKCMNSNGTGPRLSDRQLETELGSPINNSIIHYPTYISKLYSSLNSQAVTHLCTSQAHFCLFSVTVPQPVVPLGIWVKFKLQKALNERGLPERRSIHCDRWKIQCPPGDGTSFKKNINTYWTNMKEQI